MDLLCFQLLNNDDYWAGRMRCNDIELSLPNNKYIVCNISDISLFYHEIALYASIFHILFDMAWPLACGTEVIFLQKIFHVFESA